MDIRMTDRRQEQSRARYPDEDGYVERDGVKIYYEVYGTGEPTVLLVPTWEIVHSRSWKFQIPYLARHCRVVTFDPRGNGRSDRPAGYDAYRRREFAADAVAVLDAAGVDRAIVVNWCDMGESLILAAEHPERVASLVFIAPPLSEREQEHGVYPFDAELDTDEGWAKETRSYWLRDWPGYVEFFFAMCLTEPHSTKPIEDCVGWAMDTDMETILAGFRGWETKIIGPAEVAELGQRVSCPVLVIHGTDRRRLRHELGYGDDEQVCMVTVGGSGVGGHLLRRVVEAFPEAKRRIPGLRMVVVTGPRIDPGTFSEQEGLEVRGFIPELYRHLAACDLAIVQGGLTTCMELTATRRPFLYVPLRHHFEQNFHVRHRLNQYGAGRMLDFDLATPDAIADMITQEIGRQVDYRAGRARRCRTSRGPHRRAPVVLRRINYRADLSGVLLSTVELLILRRPLSLINPYAVCSRITRPSLK